MKIPITIQNQAGVLVPNVESDRKGVFIYTRVDNNKVRNVHLQRVWKPNYKGKDTPWTYYRRKRQPYEKTTKYVGCYFDEQTTEEVLEVISQMCGISFNAKLKPEQSPQQGEPQPVRERIKDAILSDDEDKVFTEKEFQEYY